MMKINYANLLRLMTVGLLIKLIDLALLCLIISIKLMMVEIHHYDEIKYDVNSSL